MKRITLLTLITFCLAFPVFTQEIPIERHGKIYIGIQPSFYVEPNETDRALYLNIMPLVVEMYANEWIGIRVNTIFSLRFGADGPEISQVGLGAGLPLYLGLFNDTSAIPRLYAGPGVSGTYNFFNHQYVLTTAGILGYSMDISDRFVLNLEGQIGASFFFLDDFSFEDITSHLGFVFNGGMLF